MRVTASVPRGISRIAALSPSTISGATATRGTRIPRNRTRVGRLKVNGPAASLTTIASPARSVASRLPWLATLPPARFTPRKKSSLAPGTRGPPTCRTPPNVPLSTEAPGRNHFVRRACTAQPGSGSIGKRPRSRNSRTARSRAGAGNPAVDSRRGVNVEGINVMLPLHRTRCSRQSTTAFRPVQYSRPAPVSRYAASTTVRSGLPLRALAPSLWPLGLALQVSVVVGAGRSDPDSVGRAIGITTVAGLLVLLAVEQALPYRRDWSIR